MGGAELAGADVVGVLTGAAALLPKLEASVCTMIGTRPWDVIM